MTVKDDSSLIFFNKYFNVHKKVAIDKKMTVTMTSVLKMTVTMTSLVKMTMMITMRMTMIMDDNIEGNNIDNINDHDHDQESRP